MLDLNATFSYFWFKLSQNCNFCPNFDGKSEVKNWWWRYI